MRRLALLALAVALTAGCGGGGRSPAASRHVVLRPGEHRAFGAGVLRPGELVTCDAHGHRLAIRVPDHPNAGAHVGSGVATPAGTHAALTLTAGSRADGSITVTCRRGKGQG